VEGDLQKAFGRALRAERLRRGISQENWGAVLGMHRTRAGAIERGEQNLTLRAHIAADARGTSMGGTVAPRRRRGYGRSLVVLEQAGTARHLRAKELVVHASPVISPLVGSDVLLVIRNGEGGRVLDVALSEPVEAAHWDVLEARLLSLIEIRQPSEFRLDVDDVGGLARFPAGLRTLDRALQQFGSALTVSPTAGEVMA